MTIENVAPEEKKPEVPETPAADQTAPVDSTSGAASLQDIVASHVETHSGFDPSIHATNEDGSPKMKEGGGFAKKRGRKPGSPLPPKSGPVERDTQKAEAPQAAPTPARISADEAARQSANLVVNVAVWTCGEQIGIPQDKEEAAGLMISFKNYYDARGVPNLPPEIGLILALGSYLVPRFRKSEKAMTLFQKAGMWIKSKLGK